MHRGNIKAESGGGYNTFTFFLRLVFDGLKLPSEEVIEIAKNFLKNGTNIKLIARSIGLQESQTEA